MAATVCILFAMVVQASDHGSRDEPARIFRGISSMESASEENDLTHTLYYMIQKFPFCQVLQHRYDRGKDTQI